MLSHTEIRTKSGIKCKENLLPGFCLIVDMIPMPISSDMYVTTTKNGWNDHQEL